MSKIAPNTEKYVPARAASGAKSMHNGDPVAIALAGLNLDEVRIVAEGMGVEDPNKYDKLNVGQIRMNLGNRIRGRISAIDKENEKLTAEAAKEDATAKVKKAAEKAKSGEQTLLDVSKGPRKDADKRDADAVKAKAAKAKAAKAKEKEASSEAA